MRPHANAGLRSRRASGANGKLVFLAAAAAFLTRTGRSASDFKYLHVD